MLKSAVVDPAYTWGEDRHPHVAWEDTIIYEAHVKGLTQQREDVPKELRGTYRGLAAPAMIEHLHKLGVTAIELLPIHSYLDERHLLEHGRKNYWGYNSLSFFAPEQRYAADNVRNAFRSTVAELHSAGIEVILDVVYNHTCEGNHLGPTLCYKGIDNAAYYWLVPDQPRFYENHTGTGNALNLTHPRVLQMVMDSLRYWVEVFHIDGFRFDLASTLGRTPAFDPHAAFFAAIRQDPVLANVKLIAEPWDIGPGGYQVGGFPPGWSEWNDIYRKTLRRYWRGEGNLLGDLAGALTGSAAQYRHDGRGPQASINHVTVHDGFTLADLVSYENKHNEANGEDNRDGSDDNVSLNCGAEGPTEDPAIVQCRRLLRRNQLASLMLAQGIPLVLAGDEVGNSQGGNNNAYCQDNEIGWVDWSGLKRQGDNMTEFVGGLARLRKRFAQLRSRHWLEGKKADGSYDVLWLRPDGAEMSDEDWHFPEGRFLAYVLAPPNPSGEPLLLMLQRHAGRDRSHAAVLARCRALEPRARHRDRPGARRGRRGSSERPRSRRSPPRSWRSRANHERRAMNHASRFGPLITPEGVTFRLWAPGAKRVELVSDQTLPMQRCDDGWCRDSCCPAPVPARDTASASTARSRCPIPPRASSPTMCTARAR